ncbi:MAG: PH domain-containing protein [Eubacteriales bacterium]|jgi:membrane protein YdbS with pleckstrin-like domain|nr:PH domain-containing protein [Eubacteriales bacterium]
MNEDQETNMVSGTWGSDSPMLNIDPKAIKMWRLGRLIALIILVVGAAATHILLSLRTDFFADTTAATIFYISWSIVIGFQLLNLIVYPIIEFRQWAYCLTEDRIEYRKGIIFRQITIIPITRIQHVTVNEGPLARLYGLAGIEITTAGSTSKIDGLAKQTAVDLCDKMKNSVNLKILNKKINNGELK